VTVVVGAAIAAATVRTHHVRRRAAARLVQLLDVQYLLLRLHPPVLEPDLDLPLGEAERVGDLDAALPRQVAVELELLLELERLVSRVGLSAAPTLRRVGSCGRQQQ